MNSTDQEKAIDGFFEHVLMPLATSMQASGKLPLDSRIDSTISSYFVARKSTSLDPGDFELPSGIEDSDSLRSALEQFWSSVGSPELAAAAAEIARLAENLKVEEEQSEEVSPFVYAMY